jgi:uncharacterized protein YbcI
VLQTPEIQAKVRDAAAKLHKDFTGRGPTSLRLEVVNCTITLTFDHFLTSIERCVLRDPTNRGLILDLRSALARSLIPDWQQLFAACDLEVVAVDGEIDFEQEKRVVRITVKEKSS